MNALGETLVPVRTRLPLGYRLLHWAIIAHLALGSGYAGWQLFSIVPPGHGGGPLWDAASTMPHDLMMTRRMYALESWLAMCGLAMYLGLTEILPRRLNRRE